MGDRRATLILLLILSFILPTFAIPLVNAVEDSWTTLEPMPTTRSGLGVAVVDGKIYAIGGDFNGTALGTNEMYDPATNSWTTKTSMPTARTNFAIAVYENKIHVIGGYIRYVGYSSAHEVYDPLTDTWETKEGRWGAYYCANVVDGKIYLMGGSLSPFPPWPTSDQNTVYDPLTDSWSSKTPMPTAVSHYASAVIDNKIYVLGGCDVSQDAIYNLTQIYDPETNTWSNGTSLPVAVRSGAAVATSGFFAPKRIHVLSGLTSSFPPVNYVNQTQVYDPEINSWTIGTPMIPPRIAVGVAVINDELYVIGGYDGENYRNVNEKYTPVGYIPEFPSWIILPLFLTATLFVIVFKKRLLYPRS